MGTPISVLSLTGQKLHIKCSYCSLTRILESLEANLTFGENTTFDEVEKQPCPRCQIKNDPYTRWIAATICTPEDEFRAAHPGKHLVKNGRRPRQRSKNRWAQ